MTFDLRLAELADASGGDIFAKMKSGVRICG